jgi:hypothetical protein
MLYPANGMQKENKEFIRDKKALAGAEMQGYYVNHSKIKSESSDDAIQGSTTSARGGDHV